MRQKKPQKNMSGHVEQFLFFNWLDICKVSVYTGEEGGGLPASSSLSPGYKPNWCPTLNTKEEESDLVQPLLQETYFLGSKQMLEGFGGSIKKEHS